MSSGAVCDPLADAKDTAGLGAKPAPDVSVLLETPPEGSVSSEIPPEVPAPSEAHPEGPVASETSPECPVSSEAPPDNPLPSETTPDVLAASDASTTPPTIADDNENTKGSQCGVTEFPFDDSSLVMKLCDMEMHGTIKNEESEELVSLFF